MPLEQVQPDGLLPIVERQRAGRSLRRLVPRAQHATWTPQPDRRDPVDILVETSRHRISSLLPIRYGRMQKSPFAFLRGSAAVMAADLATMPPSGIWVQSCGDCHLANFGTYAAPDGSPVFDITDFDETLPAPFEWDLKRLTVSFAVDGKSRGMADRLCHQLARRVVAAYRRHMAATMRLDPLSTWRSRIDVTDALRTIDDAKLRERELKRLRTAADAYHKGYPKLLERRKNGWRIRPRSQLVLQLCDQDDDTHELVARTAFETYKYALPEERAVLLDRYRLVDVAFKVVGIGCVGTFCAIGLFVTRDDATLLLQLTEAQQSVLAPYAAPSIYTDQGQRVVTGPRITGAARCFSRLNTGSLHRPVLLCATAQGLTSGDGRSRNGRRGAARLCHAVRQHAGARAREVRRCGKDRRLHGVRRGIRRGDCRVRHGLCRPGDARLASVRRGNQGGGTRGTGRMTNATGMATRSAVSHRHDRTKILIQP
jgi:uncharacterized protein (DUF2252 family)